MKRMLALTLSLLMLLTVAIGCNKEVPEEITDSRISADLTTHSGNYSYAHIEGTPDVTNMQVLHREETTNNTSIAVTATAVFDNAEITFAATVHYRLNGLKWRLHSIDVSKADVTVTGAPNEESVLDEVSNCISIYGSTLAKMDKKYHNLTFSPQEADWELQYEAGSKTATLAVSYTSEKLSFAGSYTLTFGEKGWVFDSEERMDGRRYPILHLTELKQK